MNRIIFSMENKYLQSSLDMIRRTFSNSETAEDALIVVNLGGRNPLTSLLY